MTYVYLLRSLKHPDRHYVGVTADLRSRLKKHNAGEVSHTSKYAPWIVKTYVAFSDDAKRSLSKNISNQRRAGRLQRSAFERACRAAANGAYSEKKPLTVLPAKRMHAAPPSAGREPCSRREVAQATLMPKTQECRPRSGKH